MSKQHNKAENRQRRERYIKRKKTNSKTKVKSGAVAPATTSIEAAAPA